MSFIRLGEGFRREPEPEPEPEIEVVPAGPLPEELFAQAVRELRDSLAALPPPVVKTESIDLAEIVNAIQGLKGPATAGEIADALALRIMPSEPQGESGVVAAIRDIAEKIDFRMKGAMPAFGASGPSNISSDPNRLVGRVTVDGVVSTLSTDESPERLKKHIEFIPSSSAPTTIYTGWASPGTADSAAAWTIQKIVFTGETAIDETWSAAGSAVWDDRASTTYS